MTDTESSFIEESIRPGKHRRIRKFVKNVGMSVVFGAIFGITAGVGFSATGLIVGEKGTEDVKTEMTLVVPTEEPATETPSAVKEQENQTNQQQSQSTDADSEITQVGDSIEHYNTLYKDLSAYCESFDSSIVNLAKSSKEMDYFENQIERTSSFYGLVIQKRDRVLYIMTQSDEMEEEYSYSMVIDDKESIPAKLIGVDNVTGIAVMTVDLSKVEEHIYNSYNAAIIGSSQGISIGDMVVAIGNPMGTMGSVGYGVVCSEPRVEYVQDRKICVYNTGMQNVERGNGVIIDTSGKVIGIITHRFSNDMNLCSFIGINEMKAVLEKIMNNELCVGMGIVPMDIGRNYFKDKKIKNGIYVSDLFAGSAAMNAGIVVGDIITNIDGQKVKSVDEYMTILAEHTPGDVIEISIYCDYASKNKSKKVEVNLLEAE